ncbi:aspartate/glutamate racemase family protein [Pseudomonas sp. dw_358]|uniref:aspartate/glutamate racemase family protein n=1 Tax=Pseudomonas sp. dw_358 TaxID=2720083 RepID=UPI001BD1E75B|nr:aspartate/glutamate racemase family protein [Pseudomonas sp. dw_358]
MQSLGILGGMSWESTLSYYRWLNEGVRERLGGLHSAPLILHSVDFAGIAALQKSGDWDQAGRLLAEAAQGLERAGAKALLLATNTMHKVAPLISSAVNIPLLHIGDGVGVALQSRGIKRVALLGTRFTLQQDFYRLRLVEQYGFEVLLPDAEAIIELDRIIYSELCLGVIRDVSRQYYLDCLAGLREAGAEAAVLGCTEISLLLDPGNSPLPLVDSTAEHVRMGLEWLLGNDRLNRQLKTNN